MHTAEKKRVYLRKKFCYAILQCVQLIESVIIDVKIFLLRDVLGQGLRERGLIRVKIFLLYCKSERLRYYSRKYL